MRGDNNVPALPWSSGVKSRVDDVKKMPYMIAYTSSTAKRDELVKLCKKEFGHAPLLVFQLGGVVSANTGPDGIAIVFEGKPRRLVDYGGAAAVKRGCFFLLFLPLCAGRAFLLWCKICKTEDVWSKKV